jgi:hypothetical protein
MSTAAWFAAVSLNLSRINNTRGDSPIQSEGEDEEAFWDFDMGFFLMLKPRDLKSENRDSIPQRIP